MSTNLDELTRTSRAGHRFHVRQDLTAISPACAGRSHRRCLLADGLSPCPCHRDEPVPETVVVSSEGFPCAICLKPFRTELARAYHFADDHPVSTSAWRGQYEVGH